MPDQSDTHNTNSIPDLSPSPSPSQPTDVDPKTPFELPPSIPLQPPRSAIPVSIPRRSNIAMLTSLNSAEPAPLSRAVTNHSINSLRRMVTHETGEFLDSNENDTSEMQETTRRRGGSIDSAADPRTRSDDHEEARIGSPTDHDHDDHDHDHDHEDEEETHESEEVGEKGNKRSKKSKRRRQRNKEEPELQDQTNLLPVKQVIFVVCGLTCALFCSLLDQTIVTTALPTLGRVFNRADISPWVGTAYLLTSTSMQPIYGRLSDIFGRKMVLLGALSIFLVGSLACALAQSMIQLIVFRAIQGMGGGGIITLAMIIISDVVTLKDRGKYQGIVGVVVATSNSLGPILGGVFTEEASWRWCFYINLPLTSCAILIIIFLLPLRRVKGAMLEKLRTLDWYGSVLTLAWAVGVLLALSWAGSQYSWSSAAVLVPLVLGFALLGLWLYVEARLVPLPLVPMRIFKNATVASAMATTFLSGMIFYSTLYYLPMYFQVVRGVSAVRSGVLILPLVSVQTVTSFTAGLIQSKTGDYWWNLTIGFTIWTIGVGLLSCIDEDTHIARLAIYQMIDGIGAGQTFQTSLVAIQAGVARKDMATATGMRNFLRMLGGTLALTICSTILSNLARNDLEDLGFDAARVSAILSDPTSLGEYGLTDSQKLSIVKAYAHGVQACFWFMIPCSGISLFLTLFFVKRISLKRDDDAEKKAEAKAWLESKKAKHRHGKRGSQDPISPISPTTATDITETETQGSVDESRRESMKTIVHPTDHSAVGRIKAGERDIAEVARREEQAMGVSPPEKDLSDRHKP